MNTTIMDGRGNKTEVENRTRRMRRGLGEGDVELIIREKDLELFLRAKEIVESTSIEGLRYPRNQTVGREEARSYLRRPVIWDEEMRARARYN
jgi:hypothetical protein